MEYHTKIKHDISIPNDDVTPYTLPETILFFFSGLKPRTTSRGALPEANPTTSSPGSNNGIVELILLAPMVAFSSCFCDIGSRAKQKQIWVQGENLI